MGFAPPGQNPEWKQGLLLQTWVQTATVLLFIKSETQRSTTIVLNHLKKISSGFSVFKGKFNILALYAKLLSL